MKTLQKLVPGDRVAIVSPSLAAPALWPHIYQLGLERLRSKFNLVPVEYPATGVLGASAAERSKDLIDAFSDPQIKAVISTLGGDDQVTYVKHLPDEPFRNNPKPFFGYSDNTHFMNHLWLNGVPSFYGGALFTQFAQTPRIDSFTEQYLRPALFESTDVTLTSSSKFNDVGVDWSAADIMTRQKEYEDSAGWIWDGTESGSGLTWGGCVESIDEMLRHGVRIPDSSQFEDVVLIAETSEELPDHEYVRRVFRALGERGILGKVRALLVGRPKAWECGKERPKMERNQYRTVQSETILKIVRHYNSAIPIVQNVDFGHTNPQICLPFGSRAVVNSTNLSISVKF